MRSPTAIDRCFNVEDLRAVARRRLPSPIFGYLDGGADDGWSIRNNIAAFDRYGLMPHLLNDVSKVDLRSRLFGADIAMPLMLSPTGMSRLFHRDKELGVARAATAAGVPYSLSTMGTASIEAVAAAGTGPRMFQVYLMKDRGVTAEFVTRCKAAGYTAMSITVDTAIGGNRETDRRFGLTMPPKLSLPTMLRFAAAPGWSFSYLRDPDLTVSNVAHLGLGNGPVGPGGYVAQQLDRAAGWRDVEWLAKLWGGPFAVKGLMSAGDAAQAAEAGASAVMISNHGGRQLDGAPAPIDCVAPIRDRVGDRLELIVDGGVRRGTHILKALALGANACAIGRPYLYGLAAGGEAGVVRVLQLLRAELQTSLTLLGRPSLTGLGPGDLIHNTPPPALPA